MNEIHNRADFNLFRVLEAIESTGGISSAAEQLHLTQSAVSHALKRLRLLLDDPLFIRQGQNMRPTTYARSIMPTVREHLRGLSGCIESAKEFDPKLLDCEFHFGFRDPTESLVFPYLLPALTTQAPGVRVVSHHSDPSTVERDLTQGKLDLAVDTTLEVSSHIQSQVFYSESVVVLHSKNHPLAKPHIDLATYAAAQHVMVTHNPLRPSLLERSFAEAGIKRNLVLKAQHYFAASQVIATTDWLMLVPETYAGIIRQQLPVAYSPCPFPVPKVDLRMYWHESMEHDPGIKWLRQVAVDFVHRQQQAIRKLAKS